MPYSRKKEREKGRNKEIRVPNHVFGNYQKFAKLRSGGFNVPSPERPPICATIRYSTLKYSASKHLHVLCSMEKRYNAKLIEAARVSQHARWTRFAGPTTCAYFRRLSVPSDSGNLLSVFRRPDNPLFSRLFPFRSRLGGARPATPWHDAVPTRPLASARPPATPWHDATLRVRPLESVRPAEGPHGARGARFVRSARFACFARGRDSRARARDQPQTHSHIPQKKPKIPRKLEEGRSGGQVYALSEMTDHVALLREFYAPVANLSPRMAGWNVAQGGTEPDISSEFNKPRGAGRWIRFTGYRAPVLRRAAPPK